MKKYKDLSKTHKDVYQVIGLIALIAIASGLALLDLIYREAGIKGLLFIAFATLFGTILAYTLGPVTYYISRVFK